MSLVPMILLSQCPHRLVIILVLYIPLTTHNESERCVRSFLICLSHSSHSEHPRHQKQRVCFRGPGLQLPLLRSFSIPQGLPHISSDTPLITRARMVILSRGPPMVLSLNCSHGPGTILFCVCMCTSCSVVSDSSWTHGLQPIRLLYPPGSFLHGILRQEYWSGLLFPTPGVLSDPKIKPTSLESPTLTGGFFTTLQYSYLSTDPHGFSQIIKP